MLFVSLLGFNELAIRMPSAIAGIIASVTLFNFIKNNGNLLWAWCSTIVLITSIGFVHFHTARTGDTDSLLTLFLLLANIQLFYVLKHSDSHQKQIWLYFLFLGLAFGCKSMAALLFLPAHLLLLVYFKKVKTIIRSKVSYVAAAFFLLLCAFFIFSRQLYDQGYIKSLIQNDVMRLTSVSDNHNEPFDFYFNNFYNYRFSCWITLFGLGVGLLFLANKASANKHILVWALSLIVCQLTIISLSVTKLEWYDMPLYPYLAIVAGYAIYFCLERLSIFSKESIVPYWALLLVFSVPLYYSIKQSHDNDRKPGDRKMECIEDYIFDKSKKGFNFNNYCIIDNHYNGPMLFYKYKLQDKGQQINLIDTSQIKAPCKLIVANDTIRAAISKKFNYTVIDSYVDLTVLNIESNK